MDYVLIIVITIITLSLLNNRNIKELNKIQKQNKNIKSILKDKNEKFTYLKLNFEEIKSETFLKAVSKINTEYIYIEDENIYINDKTKNVLIANFIDSRSNFVGFNYISVTGETSIFKKIVVDFINYLNIFNKNNLNNFGVIILKKDSIKSSFDFTKKEIKLNNILIFLCSKKIRLEKKFKKIEKKEYLSIYLKKIYNANKIVIIKLMLIILTGYYMTSKLIYMFINFSSSNFIYLITLILLYLCYSYILKNIYQSIGKKRIFASYIFQIYFLAYVFIIIYSFLCKIIIGRKTLEK